VQRLGISCSGRWDLLLGDILLNPIAAGFRYSGTARLTAIRARVINCRPDFLSEESALAALTPCVGD
jgi:hypothetical protein